MQINSLPAVLFSIKAQDYAIRARMGAAVRVRPLPSSCESRSHSSEVQKTVARVRTSARRCWLVPSLRGQVTRLVACEVASLVAQRSCVQHRGRSPEVATDATETGDQPPRFMRRILLGNQTWESNSPLSRCRPVADPLSALHCRMPIYFPEFPGGMAAVSGA